MKLQYVHWDNFRYLTGLDKSFARVVNDVLALGDKGASGALSALMRGLQSGGSFTAPLPPFILVIQYDEVSHEYGYHAEPFSDRKYTEAYKEGLERYGDGQPGWVLMLVIKNGDRRAIISVPLPAILRTMRDLTGQHQVYSHTFTTDEAGEVLSGCSYIGVTKRGWRTRWAEHLAAANRGSRYRFHEAIRHWSGRAMTVTHSVIGIGLSEAETMAMEEQTVGFETLYPKGLNMIPGGYAGLKYLRQIGAAGAHERVTPDSKHEIVNRFFETASRRGLPNPLAAANWCDPTYAEKVICTGDDRLKPDQIRNARFLASIGKTAAQVATEIGARNVPQVQRLLSGSTYSRVA
jgi:hypothetical protein